MSLQDSNPENQTIPFLFGRFPMPERMPTGVAEHRASEAEAWADQIEREADDVTMPRAEREALLSFAQRVRDALVESGLDDIANGEG